MAIESPSKCETDVAEILLQLPELILKSELRSRFYFTWGTKRKRSNPSNNQNDAVAGSPQPPPPPPPEVHSEASSPATPLSFSPSESDLKRKHKRRKSHHRTNKLTREDWLDRLNDFTQRNRLLNIEIQNVRSYYDKLENLNLLIKAKKEKAMKESSDLKIVLGTNKNIDETDKLKPHNQGLHHQPLIPDQTAQIPSRDYNESPLGIPDLNIPIEEEEESYAIEDYYQPLDYAMMANRNLVSRAMATEARRRRIEINRVKNSNKDVNNRLRYPNR